MKQEEPAGSETRVPRFSIFLFCLGNFFFWAALYIYMPILSIYSRHLGASMTLAGLVVGAYGFTQLLLRIPLGILSDRWGRRKPFIIGGFIAGIIGCLGLALSPNPWGLMLSRAMLGVSATTWVTSTVLFASYFPSGRVTQAMSLLTFFSSSSQLVTSLVGGKIAEDYGYKTPFYLGAILALCGTFGIVWIVERPVRQANAISLADLRAIGTRPLLLVVSIITAFSQYASFATTYTFTPIYAAELGASKTQLGILTTAALAPYVLGALSGAFLATHLGERKTALTGLILSAGAILVIPFISSLPLLGMSQIVNGLGRGFSYPVLMGLSIKAVPEEEQATAMGFFQAIYALGMFAGPTFGGVVADILGLKGMFISTGALCLAGSALALVGIPKERPKEPRKRERVQICEGASGSR